MKPPLQWTLKTDRERAIFQAGYNSGDVDRQMAQDRAKQAGSEEANAAALLAVEWGFRASEKGWNLERTRQEFVALMQPRNQDVAK